MGPTNAQEFRYQLDEDAEIYAVLYTAGGQPTGYSVILLALLDGGEARTVRVYDDHEIGPHFPPLQPERGEGTAGEDFCARDGRGL